MRPKVTDKHPEMTARGFPTRPRQPMKTDAPGRPPRTDLGTFAKDNRELVQSVYGIKLRVVLEEWRDLEHPEYQPQWTWRLESEGGAVHRRGLVLSYSAGDANYNAIEALGISFREPTS